METGVQLTVKIKWVPEERKNLDVAVKKIKKRHSMTDESGNELPAGCFVIAALVRLCDSMIRSVLGLSRWCDGLSGRRRAAASRSHHPWYAASYTNLLGHCFACGERCVHVT